VLYKDEVALHWLKQLLQNLSLSPTPFTSPCTVTSPSPPGRVGREVGKAKGSVSTALAMTGQPTALSLDPNANLSNYKLIQQYQQLSGKLRTPPRAPSVASGGRSGKQLNNSAVLNYMSSYNYQPGVYSNFNNNYQANLGLLGVAGDTASSSSSALIGVTYLTQIPKPDSAHQSVRRLANHSTEAVDWDCAGTETPPYSSELAVAGGGGTLSGLELGKNDVIPVERAGLLNLLSQNRQQRQVQQARSLSSYEQREREHWSNQGT